MKDFTGYRNERIEVISLSHKANHSYYWNCKCDCGQEKIIQASNLKRTKSCGCLVHRIINGKKAKHRASNTRLYQTWVNMRRRCYDLNQDSYKNYGAKGIKVCDEWMYSFESFQEWAFISGYEEHLTVERIDYTGNYEPSNCKWIPLEKQTKNSSWNRFITYQGETKCVREWARDSRCVVSLYALEKRLATGWDEIEAITTPYLRIDKRTRPPGYFPK